MKKKMGQKRKNSSSILSIKSDKMAKSKVLAFSGSTRKLSFNTALLKEVIRHLDTSRLEITYPEL
jgi:hypothetical protein